ncbi:MAG: phosphate ABC transporter substrate-binding/OmpA family protein [Planktomarina sp.]
MFISVGAAAADPVRLTLSDGSFSVSGNLVAFDGDTYQVETRFGVLSMASETTTCDGEGCPTEAGLVPVVNISGATSLGEVLMPALIEEFARIRKYEIEATTEETGVISIRFRTQNTQKDVAVFRLTLSSTAQGVADMLFGKSHFVMARRSLTPGETLAISSRYDRGNDNAVRTTVMGWEALRLFTTPGNPIEQITVKDLISMTESAPAFWPASQEDGDPVPVVLRGDFDSVSALRQQLGFTSATPSLHTFSDLAPGVLRISPNNLAGQQEVELIATCNQIASEHDLDQSAQPLKAPLYLVAAPVKLPPVARDFWGFLLTAAAQEKIAQVGYTSRTPTETTMSGPDGPLIHAILNTDDEMRATDLREAVRGLYGHGRLSLTFRFLDGTRFLDEGSQSNLGFLASLLKDGRFSGRDIIFAGFSDSQGSAEGNLQISLDRAQALRGTIRTLMGDDAPPKEAFRAVGFGEGLPLACNDTEWGQHQNRRVEIWVK